MSGGECVEEVVFPEFTFLRPIFISCIAILLLVMLVITYQRKVLMNGFSLWLIILTCIVVSGITLFMSGFIVDEYNLSGDEQSFYMFLGIIVISILNVITFYIKKGRI
ncbi:hypothetical protein [Bacillus cereus]